jgi:hypothetical protein
MIIRTKYWRTKRERKTARRIRIRMMREKITCTVRTRQMMKRKRKRMIWSRRRKKKKREQKIKGRVKEGLCRGEYWLARLRHDPCFLLLVCHYSITHSSSSLFRRRVLPHRDAGHAVAQHGALSLIKNSVSPATHCGLQVSTRRLPLWFILFVNLRPSIPFTFNPLTNNSKYIHNLL